MCRYIYSSFKVSKAVHIPKCASQYVANAFCTHEELIDVNKLHVYRTQGTS